MFLIDNRDEPTTRRKAKDPYVIEYAPDLHLRQLNDGSEYRVVKVMYEPDELESLIEAERWQADIDCDSLVPLWVSTSQVTQRSKNSASAGAIASASTS